VYDLVKGDQTGKVSPLRDPVVWKNTGGNGQKGDNVIMQIMRPPKMTNFSQL